MNGPEKIWNSLLANASSVYGSAVVAGGAVRDWSLNKNILPRDIDVFVTVEDENDLGMGIRGLEESGLADVQLLSPDKSNYNATEFEAANVLGVLEGFAYEGRVTKINVIGKAFDVYDNERLFADFDHSLAQFSYNGELVAQSAAATKTLEDGVIVAYSRSARTKKRLTDLISRGKTYERFTFVDDFDKPPETEYARRLREAYEAIANARPGVAVRPMAQPAFNNLHSTLLVRGSGQRFFDEGN